MILLSNDDGVKAEGILALRQEFLKDFDTVIVAPRDEMSASSHAVTLKKPLHIERIDENIYSVNGTPADCIISALFYILKEKPTFILSGINLGQNLGEDVFYSGTVAAAREGALYGISSAAFSIVVDKSDREIYYSAAARIARFVVNSILSKMENGVLINVNIPNLPYEDIRGIKITKLSTRRYVDVVKEENGFIVIGGRPVWQMDEGTDIVAVREGYVSITPLLKDLTYYEGKARLEKLIGDFNQGNGRKAGSDK